MSSPKRVNRSGRLVRGMAITAFAIMMAGFSQSIWLLPVMIVDSAFYDEWCRPRGGHITSWLIISWFHWGAAKIIAVALHERHREMTRSRSSPKEAQINRLSYRVKMVLLVPLAPLMDCRLTKPYFPVPGDAAKQQGGHR